MNKFFSKIDSHLNDQNSLFVFPSQTVADSAKRYGAKASSNIFCSKTDSYFFGAIDIERFMSWDDFKAIYLSSYDKVKKPFSKEYKYFFAHLIANKNSMEPFLKQVVPKEFSKNSRLFISTIIQAIDSLFLVDEENKHHHFESLIEPALWEDLINIKTKLDLFLEENNLYQIGLANKVNSKISNKKVLLFFPSVITDFHEYESLLRAQKEIEFVCEREILSKQFKENQAIRFNLFKDAKEEAKFVLKKAKAALQEKKEVIITYGSDDILQLLVYYSNLYGVKLNPRSGKSLSSTNQWNFFKKAVAIVKSGYAFNSLLEFSQLQSLSFKTQIKNKELSVKQSIEDIVQAGIQGDAIKDKSQWRLAISNYYVSKAFLDNGDKASDNDITKRNALLEFWDTLTMHIEAIANATTLSELHKAIHIFIDKYIDEQHIDKASDLKIARPYFETILSELRKLCDISETLKEGFKGDAFSFFSRYLDGRNYVLKNGEGVSLYSYKVAAGIGCDVHLICGIDEDTSKVLMEKAPFVGESQKALWNKKKSSGGTFCFSYDYTNDYLQLYGFSGKEVFISGSKIVSTYESTLQKIEPFLWVCENRVDEVSCDEADPITLLLENKESFQISPTLYRGVEYHLQSVKNQNPFNMTMKPISQKPLTDSLLSLFEKDGTIYFSPSGLENYRKCPWRELLKKIVSSPPLAQVSLFKSNEKGTFLHKVMEFIANYCIENKIIISKNSLNSSSQKEALVKRVKEYIDSIDKASLQLELGLRHPIKAIWEKEKNLAIEKVVRLLSSIIEKFGALHFYQAEKEYECAFDGYALKGRIDAVIKDEKGNLHILDYKTKLRIKVDKDFLPKNDKGEKQNYDREWQQLAFKDPNSYFPKTFQMAFYQEFLYKEFGFYCSCWYCDLDETDEGKIITQPEPSIMQKNRELMHQFIRKVLQDKKDGNYTFWDGLDCAYCDYSSICKKKSTSTQEGEE